MKSKAGLEERMAKIEGVLEQMDRRMADLRGDFDKRLEQMDRRMADLRGDFNIRLNHVESRLNWTLGTLITMWISIIGLLIMLLMK